MYVKTKDAKKQLGITDATLRHWADSGKIKHTRVPGGIRLYDVEEFLSRQVPVQDKPSKKQYIYCRVSSYKQREDLQRQIKYLQDKYPDHEVIQDIASGINFKRKGLNKILADSMSGIVQEVVVAHRDRMCRIAWEHFNWLFKYCGVNVIVEDTQEHSPESEFSDDLLSIIHVFSSRHYGIRRKYTSKKSIGDESKDSTDTEEQITCSVD